MVGMDLVLGVEMGLEVGMDVDLVEDKVVLAVDKVGLVVDKAVLVVDKVAHMKAGHEVAAEDVVPLTLYLLIKSPSNSNMLSKFN